jgi:putative transposase
MCQLAGISRSGYYRHWQLSAPRQEETGLRDAIQRLALKHRHYGYRRIGALLWREGWQTNHKRVLRLMREDNLLCLRQTPFVPATTNSAVYEKATSLMSIDTISISKIGRRSGPRV